MLNFAGFLLLVSDNMVDHELQYVFPLVDACNHDYIVSLIVFEVHSSVIGEEKFNGIFVIQDHCPMQGGVTFTVS